MPRAWAASCPRCSSLSWSRPPAPHSPERCSPPAARRAQARSSPGWAMESAVESHASAARRGAQTVSGSRARALGAVVAPADVAVAVGLAAALAAAAFIANGGLQLGPATLVEIAAILIG